MAKPSIPVNRELLETAIQVVEADGPLLTQNKLHQEVANLYNEETAGPSISAAVARLRIIEYGIQCKTQPARNRRSNTAKMEDTSVPVQGASTPTPPVYTKVEAISVPSNASPEWLDWANEPSRHTGKVIEITT